MDEIQHALGLKLAGYALAAALPLKMFEASDRQVGIKMMQRHQQPELPTEVTDLRLAQKNETMQIQIMETDVNQTDRVLKQAGFESEEAPLQEIHAHFELLGFIKIVQRILKPELPTEVTDCELAQKNETTIIQIMAMDVKAIVLVLNQDGFDQVEAQHQKILVHFVLRVGIRTTLPHRLFESHIEVMDLKLELKNVMMGIQITAMDENQIEVQLIQDGFAKVAAQLQKMFVKNDLLDLYLIAQQILKIE